MTHVRNPTRPVSDSQSERSEIIFPGDANALGNLFGGRLMQFIDLVGAMAASRHARAITVTASMDHLDFVAPVKVGDLLILKASVNRAFNTSMEVGVKAMVEDIRGQQTPPRLLRLPDVRRDGLLRQARRRAAGDSRNRTPEAPL